MKRAMVILLAAVIAAAGLTAQKAAAQEKKEKTAAAAKQGRWHGIIARFNKEQSTLDVRKGGVERKIHYDSSTRWTVGTKAAEMSEFKEGADVICLGKYDEKGELHATRIDLRSQ